MKTIEHIRVTPARRNRDLEFTIHNETDYFGEVRFFTGYADVSKQELAVIAAATAAVAGQGVLAPHLSLACEINDDALRTTTEITQLLYDSHAYAQGKPFIDVKIDADIDEAQPAPRAIEKKCLLLWSGGKDSLSALLVLRANGYEVTGIHLPANFPVKEHEKQASQKLAEQYGLKLIPIGIEWDTVRTLIRNHSTSYDEFPFKNTVPHGRDFLLAAIAAIIARRIGARYVCAGFEKELWQETFTRDGREVVRFDMHSAKASTLLNHLLESTLQVGFFSPVAAFSEFTLVKHLTEHESAAWNTITSCFWDNWCGRCIKCLKYAIVQHAIGRKLIPFQSEPVAQDNPAFIQLIHSLDSRQTHYWEMKAYCIAEIYKRGELDTMPEALALLKGKIEPLIVMQPELLKTLEQVVHPGLAPDGFRFVLK